MLKRYLKEMRLARQFSLEEFEHNFLPREGVVDTYVLRNSAGQVPPCLYTHVDLNLPLSWQLAVNPNSKH